MIWCSSIVSSSFSKNSWIESLVTSLMHAASMERDIVVCKWGWRLRNSWTHDGPSGIFVRGLLALGMRWFLISSAISRTKSCLAGWPVVVNHVIQPSKAFSSAFDNFCCDSHASTRDFPLFMRCDNVDVDRPRVFAAWYGVLYVPADSPSSAACALDSMSAAFSLLGRGMIVGNEKNSRFNYTVFPLRY